MSLQVNQTKTQVKEETNVKKLSQEVADLRDSLDEITESQSSILRILDALAEQLETMQQDQEFQRTALPAPTDRALINPDRSYCSIRTTQDAINAQGDSTMVFTYAPEQLYKIYCRRGYITDLALKKGESIRFVGGGDTAAWQLDQSVVDGVPHLYIKPVVETSTTNLIITTEKRSYQLILNTSDWYNPMVYWTYGAEDHADMMRRKAQEQSTQTGSVNVTGVEQLDFSFQVRAKGEAKEYLPEMVFSDGVRTYLKYKTLPKQQVPLFVTERGKKTMTLVNYHARDGYYIVDVPFDKAQLCVSDRSTVTIAHKG
jgi:type IV secretion system protein trbG family protein